MEVSPQCSALERLKQLRGFNAAADCSDCSGNRLTCQRTARCRGCLVVAPANQTVLVTALCNSSIVGHMQR